VSKRGYANIEVFLVMVLLFAVSFLIFATVSAGSEAYFNLSGRQDRDAALRVGLSFVDVKLRKNDAEGAIRIAGNPFGQGDALVIRSETETQVFDTWIYCLDGGLYELFTRADAQPLHAAASRITSIDRMDIEVRDGQVLSIELTRMSGGEASGTDATLSGVFYLKTGVT